MRKAYPVLEIKAIINSSRAFSPLEYHHIIHFILLFCLNFPRFSCRPPKWLNTRSFKEYATVFSGCSQCCGLSRGSVSTPCGFSTGWCTLCFNFYLLYALFCFYCHEWVHLPVARKDYVLSRCAAICCLKITLPQASHSR